MNTTPEDVSAAPEVAILSKQNSSSPSSSPSFAPSNTCCFKRDDHQNEERTCHMLPCSIDYQGMASTHVYFRPVAHDGVLSSTFRGRGLLALAPLGDDGQDTKSDDGYLSAALLSVQDQKLQVKGEIDQFLEWEHEHNPETLLLNQRQGDVPSRVLMAQQWSEVALALHEPLPVESEA